MSLSSASKIVVNFPQPNTNLYLTDTSSLSVGDEFTFINTGHYPSDILDSNGDFIAPLLSKSRTRLTVMNTNPLEFDAETYLKPVSFTLKHNDKLEKKLNAASTVIAHIPRVYNDVLYVPVIERFSSTTTYLGLLKVVYDFSAGTKTITPIRILDGGSTTTFSSFNIYNGKGYAFINNGKMIIIDLSSFTKEDTITPSSTTLSSSVYTEALNETGFYVTYNKLLSWYNPSTNTYSPTSITATAVCYWYKDTVAIRNSLVPSLVKFRSSGITSTNIIEFRAGTSATLLPVTTNLILRLCGNAKLLATTSSTSDEWETIFSAKYITYNSNKEYIISESNAGRQPMYNINGLDAYSGGCLYQDNSSNYIYNLPVNTWFTSATVSSPKYFLLIKNYLVAFSLDSYYMLTFEIT